ncbi:MAG: ATP-binding protein, partial [Vicinamibacteria bacterium]
MPRSTPGNGSEKPPVEALLEGLNLTTIARDYATLVKAAEEKKVSYTDFLRSLLAAELDARSERKRERMLKRSHLLDAKTLDQFDFSLRPQLNPAVVKELAECRYIEERRNILLLGKPG